MINIKLQRAGERLLILAESHPHHPVEFMSAEDQPELNTPEGLHYECTGCGKCCSGWSVPLTEEDYKRIVDIDWGSLSADLKDKKLFRPLPPALKKGTPYSYAIIATAEGQCPFLKNNLCFIHSQFGSQTKPAMCQLFPYSFNETPSGVYASVSFVSRGAIFNAGKALSEQKEYLQTKFKEFKRLFTSTNRIGLRLNSRRIYL